MLCMLNKEQSEEMLRNIFMEIDANGDGIIEGHELRNIVNSVNIDTALTFEDFK